VGAASRRDLRSKMQLPQKNTTSLEVQLKCPTLCVIAHGLSLKAFSLQSIYLRSHPPDSCCDYGKPCGLSSKNAGFARPSPLFSLDMVWGFLYGAGM
jgi:hypothetical protein